jgi:GT2 family glycosyltransferase
MISNNAGCVPVLVVPILTGPDLLYRLAASIDYPVSRLLVVDNGMCVDAASLRVAATRHVGSITVLPIPNNLGVAGSWNLGIKATALAPWWLVANFDVVFPEGSLQRFAETDSDGCLLLSGASPVWSTFKVTASVVERVGLFDEKIHPAYFEDDDYQTRCRYYGVPVMQTDIPVEHDNSSTLRLGDYQTVNGFTFHDNRRYMQRKHSMEDYSDGGYSLMRRRKLSWD